MQSFEHLCGGRKIVLQYGDSMQSFPKDSNFACKTKRVWRARAKTRICSMEFTVQVSTFVELKLLWNG